MKQFRFLPIAIAAAVLLAGCATQTKEQLAAVRAARVAPATVQKLEHRGILTPPDLIELKKRGVDDGVALRQIDRVGVDYVLGKKDVKALRDNKVSEAVVQATASASRRFLYRYYEPYPYYGYGGWGGPWGAWGYPYDSYYGPGWPYGGIRFTYVHGRRWH